MSTPLNEATRLTVAPRVRGRKVGAEVVLVHLEASSYFRLDPVGASIWSALERGEPLGAVRDDLVGRFDVEPDRAWSDLLDLVRDLLDQGLVSVLSTDAVGPDG